MGQRRREKERLVSTAHVCVTSSGIPPPPVPFVNVRVTFDKALSFAIQRLSCPSLTLKPEQRSIIQHVFHGNDVFVGSPSQPSTGTRISLVILAGSLSLIPAVLNNDTMFFETWFWPHNLQGECSIVTHVDTLLVITRAWSNVTATMLLKHNREILRQNKWTFSAVDTRHSFFSPPPSRPLWAPGYEATCRSVPLLIIFKMCLLIWVSLDQLWFQPVLNFQF